MIKRKRYINKKNKTLTKKQKLCLIIVFAVFFCIIFLSSIIINRSRKILDVAYYRLPPIVADSLSVQIKKSYSGKIRFKVLAADVQLNPGKAEKYDLLFTWNGARAEMLAAKAAELPASLYGQIPDSERQLGIVDGENRMLPLLYDHYEISFLKETVRRARAIPEDWNSFTVFLQKDTASIQIPLFAAGADNQMLLAFSGALAESLTGAEGYGRLVDFIKKSPSLEAVMDEPFGKLSGGTSVTLRTVLDLIVSWQRSGILHQTWFNGAEEDVASFMKDKAAAAVFMSLSGHRTLPLRTVYPYETSHFPVDSVVPDHALIAPAVVLVCYNKNPLFADTIRFLISVQAQEALSNLTQLAPASSRAGAYDKQADDVRFWAAAYTGGPVPDLMNAAFTSDVQAEKFADDVRKYLGK